MKWILALVLLVINQPSITLRLEHKTPLTAIINWQLEADDLVCIYKNSSFITCGKSQGVITLPNNPPTDYTRFVQSGDKITLKYTQNGQPQQSDLIIPYQIFMPYIAKDTDHIKSVSLKPDDH